MQITRERGLRHRKAAPAQLAPEFVLVLDRRPSYQVSHHIVPFGLHEPCSVFTLSPTCYSEQSHQNSVKTKTFSTSLSSGFPPGKSKARPQCIGAALA